MRLMFYVYLTLAYDNENKLSPQKFRMIHLVNKLGFSKDETKNKNKNKKLN